MRRPSARPPAGRHRQRGFLLNPFRFGGGAAATNTVLLAHFDGVDGSTSIIDSGPLGVALTPQGAAAISATQSRFGGTSLAALKTGHVTGAAAALALGTADFTIECWAYLVTASTAEQRGVFQFCTAAAGPSTSAATLAAFVGGSGNWAFYGAGGVLNSSLPVAAGAWVHLAMARQAGQLRTFVGGALANDNPDSTNYTGPGFAIGAYYSSVFQLDGYVDELRVTAGAALYTAAFTPPTAPFVA
jgi:hypothetical protein